MDNDCANVRTTLDGTIEDIGGLMCELRAKVSRMDAFLNGEKPSVGCAVKTAPSVPPCVMDRLRMIQEIAADLTSRLSEISIQLGA